MEESNCDVRIIFENEIILFSESQTLPMQPLGGYPHPMLIPMSMSNGFGRGMIQPRPRGAAGIRGLGSVDTTLLLHSLLPDKQVPQKVI